MGSSGGSGSCGPAGGSSGSASGGGCGGCVGISSAGMGKLPSSLQIVEGLGIRKAAVSAPCRARLIRSLASVIAQPGAASAACDSSGGSPSAVASRLRPEAEDDPIALELGVELLVVEQVSGLGVEEEIGAAAGVKHLVLRARLLGDRQADGGSIRPSAATPGSRRRMLGLRDGQVTAIRTPYGRSLCGSSGSIRPADGAFYGPAATATPG